MSATFLSPFGPLSLRDDGTRITELVWGEGGEEATPLQAEGLAQLDAWFARRLTRFDLPLDLGRGLHEKVRLAMLAIPQGETRRYGEISALVGAPPQAVGQACGANPIPILIPCHRVLGAKGLGGFSAPGGVETKVALLRFEGAAGLLI